MFRWLLGRGASARRVAQQAALIPMQTWVRTLAAHPYLTGLSHDEQAALRERTAWILASKAFSSTHDLVLTDDILVSIAVQAALPILQLNPKFYEGWSEIIVYPGGFLIPRQETGDDGVVHEYVQAASGEAWDGGPVIISWEDARAGSEASNVVIHEFAHKLDLTDGVADGVPLLTDHPQLSAKQWHQILEVSFERFNSALERIERAIPHDVDPESPAADPWFDQLPLDPYAATDPAEFFAVSAEAFFVRPQPLAAALPDWFNLLRGYFRQNPLDRLHALR